MSVKHDDPTFSPSSSIPPENIPSRRRSASPSSSTRKYDGVRRDASTTIPAPYPHSIAHLGLVGFVKDSAHTLTDYVRERRRSWDGGGRVEFLPPPGHQGGGTSTAGPIRQSKRQERMDELEGRILDRRARKPQSKVSGKVHDPQNADEKGREGGEKGKEQGGRFGFPRVEYDPEYLRASEAMRTQQHGSHTFALLGHPMGKGEQLMDEERRNQEEKGH